MSLSDMDQQTCSRFSYLLEPIRDLTKNWEVDVAGHYFIPTNLVGHLSLSPPLIFLDNHLFSLIL